MDAPNEVRICDLYRDGMSIRKICVNLGIPPSTKESIRHVLVRRGVALRSKSKAAELRPLKELEDRFWPKVNKAEGCWLWSGAKTTAGYGSIRVINQKEDSYLLAHRISYQIHCGSIPKGLEVCHKCDTPACVNPDHLFLGTHAENMADAVSKNRMHPGELHGRAKLTNAQVQQIRSLRESGTSQKELADKFHVSPGHISWIVNRKGWV